MAVRRQLTCRVPCMLTWLSCFDSHGTRGSIKESFIFSVGCAENALKCRIVRSPTINMLHPQELSPRISLYTPGSPNPGQLVIICSWADARREQISKYIQLHNVIEPGASILLIQTSITTLFEPYAWQRSALQPAARYIIESTDTKLISSQWGKSGSKRRVVLHSFANGGSLTVLLLNFLSSFA